jgi:hypothetical protein
MRYIGKRARENRIRERGFWWLLVAMFAFHRERGKFHIVQFLEVAKLRIGSEEHVHGKKRTEEDA